ncbi:hypothetical protein D3C78_1390000 [compost metagenome]
MVAADLLQRGLQVGAADGTAAGDEARGVVMGGEHQLLVLQRGGNARGGGDIFPVHIGRHDGGDGQEEGKGGDQQCTAHHGNPRQDRSILSP